MATTIATESSILSVAADLVTERSVCVKVLLIAVYLVHLCGSSALVVLYALNLKQRCLEFGLTIGFLLFGLIITSIVNLVGYLLSHQRRSATRKDGITIERKDPEIAETSEAMWNPLRVLFSILPLCPIIRYIECLYESHALMMLEHKLLGDKPAPKRQYRETTAASDDVRSLRSAVEENGLLEEKVQRSIRRQRRAFRRSEQGAARIGLLQAAVTAGPLAVLQVCLLARRDQTSERFNLAISSAEVKVVTTCSITCVIWLAAAMTQFYPARRVATDPDGEQNNAIRWFGQCLIFLWHLIMLVVRILPLALFASSFHFWIIVPLSLHVAGCVVAHILYKRARPPPSLSYGQSGPASRSRLESIAFDVFYAYVMIFDFVNGNQGRTRMRYLLYYAIVYAENVLLIVAWYCYMPMYDVWYRMTALMLTLSLFFLGFLFMQLYYLYFHPNADGLSLCGACQALSAATRKRLYMGGQEEKFDPVVGGNVQPGGVPYWVERDDVFGVPGAPAPPMSEDTASSVGREGSTIVLVQPPHAGRSTRPPISAMRGGANKSRLKDDIVELNQEASSPTIVSTALPAESEPKSAGRPELKPRIKARVTIAPDSII